jgi:hypothetical protein
MALDFSDVLDKLWVRHDVASGLVVQEVPGSRNTAVGLGEDGAFVGLCNGAISVVFGTARRSVTFVEAPLEKGPVVGFVVGGRASGAVPIDCVYKLTDALIWLLRLAIDFDSPGSLTRGDLLSRLRWPS